jgi:hypothetical protein
VIIFKKFIIILFCIHLSAPSLIEELVRIPNLISHYRLHKKENRALSLSQFLFTHYLKEHSDGHDDLPFHHNHDCSLHQLIAIANNWEMTVLEFTTIKKYAQESSTWVQYFILSKVVRGIWKPPKFIL